MNQPPEFPFFVRGVARTSDSETIVVRTADLVGQDEALETIEAALPIVVTLRPGKVDFAALVHVHSDVLGPIILILRAQSFDQKRLIVQRRFTLIPPPQINLSRFSLFSLLYYSLSDIPLYEPEAPPAPPESLTETFRNAALSLADRVQQVRWLIERDQSSAHPLLLDLLDALISGGRIGISPGNNESAAQWLVDSIYSLLPLPVRHELPLAMGVFDDQACSWARILLKWNPWNVPDSLVRVETDQLTPLGTRLAKDQPFNRTGCLYIELLSLILRTDAPEPLQRLIERLADPGGAAVNLGDLAGLGVLPLLLPFVPATEYARLFLKLLEREDVDRPALVSLLAAHSGTIGRASLWDLLRAEDADKRLLAQLCESTADDELGAWIRDPALKPGELRRLLDQGLDRRLRAASSPDLRTASVACLLQIVELDAAEVGLAEAEARANSFAEIFAEPGNRFVLRAAAWRGAFLTRLDRDPAAHTDLLAAIAVPDTLASLLAVDPDSFDSALYQPLYAKATAIGDGHLALIADNLRAIVHSRHTPEPYVELATNLGLDLTQRAALYGGGLNDAALPAHAQGTLLRDLIHRVAQDLTPDRHLQAVLAPLADWLRQNQSSLAHLLDAPRLDDAPWERIAAQLIPGGADLNQTERERLLLLDDLSRLWPEMMQPGSPMFLALSRRWIRLLAGTDQRAYDVLETCNFWHQLEVGRPDWLPIIRALTRDQQGELPHGKPAAPLLIAMHHELTLGVATTLAIASRLAARTHLSLDQIAGLLGLFLAFRKPIPEQHPLAQALSEQAPALPPLLASLQDLRPDVWQQLHRALTSHPEYAGLIADWVLKAGLPDLLRGPLISTLADQALHNVEHGAPAGQTPSGVDQSVLAALLRSEALVHFGPSDLIALYTLVWLAPEATDGIEAQQIAGLQLERDLLTTKAVQVAGLLGRLPPYRGGDDRLPRIMADAQQWGLDDQQQARIMLAAPLTALLTLPGLLDDLALAAPQVRGHDRFAELRAAAWVLPVAQESELQQRRQLYSVLIGLELSSEAFAQSYAVTLRAWRDTVAPHNREIYYSALGEALRQGLEAHPDLGPRPGRPQILASQIASIFRDLDGDLARERDEFGRALRDYHARCLELFSASPRPADQG